MTQQVYDYTSTRISPATICNVMRKHGLTRKKIQRIAIQRSASHRGVYIAEMSMYKSSMLVFADETGKDGRDSVAYPGGGGCSGCSSTPLRLRNSINLILFNMPKPVSLAIDCFTWI